VSWARHEILLSTELGQLDYKQNQLRRNHDSNSPTTVNTIDIYQPEYGKYLPNLTPFTDIKERQRYFALNVQDQIFFNDQWSVLFGNRFDQVEQDFKNHIK
ncbi:TonB-dependent receptor domain-containing protein, partial [Burkholderia cenocepacia]|uniref:TonB-dependent receptor domain-containing protein n=1 Tax=Burkholderia cenocepacia TaxID=95486 RepID=UPI0024B6AF8B